MIAAKDYLARTTSQKRLISAVMADVVVDLGHANIERGIARHAELLTRRRRHPEVGACELVLAGARHAFHDFWCAGAEGQGGGQDHADGFLRTVGEGDAVAHAFAIKVHIGLGGDGHAFDFFGDHEMH